ncbi:hypothetical protein ACP275_13G033900 [Erythranthe tilingii]
MGVRKILKLKYEDLACYTDNFSESNYLSHFQFGNLYRGKIVRDNCTLNVMVKIWEVSEIYVFWPGDNEGRLVDEVMMLRPEIHPGIVKMYGYCNEYDHLGVVYEFEPFDSVFNLIPKDDFTWLQRIKVAFAFASLLKFLHAPKCSFYKPYIVRNLDCAHLVVDKDYNPKLCDFGLITGGIFPDRTIYKCHPVTGSCGYIDCNAIVRGAHSETQDVFAFGVILLNLISKRVYKRENRGLNEYEIYEWAWKEYLSFNNLLEQTSESEWHTINFSLVDQSLTGEPDFDADDGEKLSEMLIECTRADPSDRPNIKQIVRSLLKLKVVKKNADFLGLKKVTQTSENTVA